MIEEFLSNLASRLRNENDLSDVTWAMCQTSEAFQTVFLSFFFPNEQLSDIQLEREKSNDDSRPDFYFESGGFTFLIECKIYDRNHHFEQYIKKFKIPNSHLGYITGYPYQKKGFLVHTWAELFFFLRERIPEGEEALWNGYLRYLQQVCAITEFSKPMNLNGMSSLYTFYQSLDEVFANSCETFSSCYYDSRKDTNNGGNYYAAPRDGVMGKFFEIDFKGRQFRKSWGWMGVYFCNEDPIICIGFSDRDGWGRPVYNKLLAHLQEIKKGKTFNEPYRDDGNTKTDAIWFDFSENDRFDELNLEGQKSLLKQFFVEVMNTIYNVSTK